jgi:hypothetical protein
MPKRSLCHQLALTLSLIAVLLGACSRSASYGDPIVLSPTPAPTLASSSATIVAPAMPLLETIPERPLYTLNVTLDYENNVVNTQERIEFRNPTGAPTSEIKFNVPPAHHPGIIDIQDARIFGQPQALSYTISNTVLTVKLPAPLGAQSGIALAFNFKLQIPMQETVEGIGGDDSSRSANSLTAGHWYIMLAPFQNGDWDTPAYVPVGDPYVSDTADYEVNILAPKGVTIAGAGDEQRDGNLWHYSLSQARMFAFAASDVFKVDSIEQDGITYYMYSYPAHRKNAEAVLYTAMRAVTLYSKLFGPYPYDTLRIVETGRSQGQEYSGLVGLGTVLYNGYPGRGSRHDLISTTVHEVSHQWWFHGVGNDQVRTPWLDESFARMSELLFYEKYYPRDADWWYKHYISGSSAPKGNINLSIYGYASSKAYTDAVYRRGMMFLNDLRKQMGKTAFNKMLQDYYGAEVYNVTTPDAFFDAVARNTDEDISKLVQTYFDAPPALPCKISNNAPGCRQ